MSANRLRFSELFDDISLVKREKIMRGCEKSYQCLACVAGVLKGREREC